MKKIENTCKTLTVTEETKKELQIDKYSIIAIIIIIMIIKLTIIIIITVKTKPTFVENR